MQALLAHLARHRARRTALPDRAERLRQEHAAQHDRRPARRRPPARSRSHGKPVRGPLPHDIAFVFQENALFPWCTVIENVKLGMVFQGVPKAEQEPRARQVARGGRPQGFHGPLSGAAFRRHAPARGARPRAQPADRHPADGRAVRRARRADPHDPRRGPLGAAVAHRQDHRVRHPFARRGGVPRRPRRGVLGAARPHQGDHRGRRAASAQARLRHHGEVRPAAQHALRAAARRNPQGRRAVGRGGPAAMSARRDRRDKLASRAVQVGFVARRARCSGISARPTGASAASCCPTRSMSGTS